jgi:hypothetical protein
MRKRRRGDANRTAAEDSLPSLPLSPFDFAKNTNVQSHAATSSSNKFMFFALFLPKTTFHKL